MPLRIGFDLDGTIADMHGALRSQAEQLFGAEILGKAARSVPADGAPAAAAPPGAESDDAVRLDVARQLQLWDHVRTVENFWAGLREMEPGIVARIAQAARTRRWEVIFLTTRPAVAGETTQLQSQRWLDAHGFQYPSVFVVQNSRGKIADALQLDAVVDDRPENCVEIATESTAKAILIARGDATAVPASSRRRGVRTVPSISDALALLEQLDDLQNQGGVVSSIRKLLGRALA